MHARPSWPLSNSALSNCSGSPVVGSSISPLSLEEKLYIVESVSRGLAHAHDRSIIHRDIKPRNIFLTDAGEVKLLDFGLAQIAYSTLTAAGQIIGHPDHPDTAPYLVRDSCQIQNWLVPTPGGDYNVSRGGNSNRYGRQDFSFWVIRDGRRLIGIRPAPWG